MFATGTDGALWHRYFLSAEGWGPWQSLGGALSGLPGVVSWAPGRIDVFAKGSVNNHLLHRWYDGTW